ncbi:hypothetical protein ACFQVD_30470 [Streptosporangium amethystogenes subsp. fukuiense]|uniref:Uncharacterized protein n=1 Tax=Streptosporangium amethystogenes subsp. fukuiense TaxID=698418 RepID=A0ABW2T8X3_9ACTN
MIKETIPVDQYGIDPRTTVAAQFRANNPHITPGQNVATFHLTRRRGMDDEGKVVDCYSANDYPDLIITAPSLGVQFKQDVGVYGRQITLNTSHSEYQLFEHNTDFAALRKAEKWPRNYVIDWVFTERPACGARFHNWKVVAGGCETLLLKCEENQSLRRWDPDNGGEWPFTEREDLQIKVYSMFDPQTATSAVKAAAAAYKKTLK